LDRQLRRQLPEQLAEDVGIEDLLERFSLGSCPDGCGYQLEGAHVAAYLTAGMLFSELLIALGWLLEQPETRWHSETKTQVIAALTAKIRRRWTNLPICVAHFASDRESAKSAFDRLKPLLNQERQTFKRRGELIAAAAKGKLDPAEVARWFGNSATEKVPATEEPDPDILSTLKGNSRRIYLFMWNRGQADLKEFQKAVWPKKKRVTKSLQTMTLTRFHLKGMPFQVKTLWDEELVVRIPRPLTKDITP
jgi:hypothetical protein